MSEKLYLTKGLLAKALLKEASLGLSKASSMLRSSLMNKPKLLDNSMAERLKLVDKVALPLGPTL